MNKSDVLDTLINTEIAVKEFGHHTRGIIDRRRGEYAINEQTYEHHLSFSSQAPKICAGIAHKFTKKAQCYVFNSFAHHFQSKGTYIMS